MMEDCATTMSAPQGCTDNRAVIGIFMEALKAKVGAERYRMWFNDGVEYALVSRPDWSPSTTQPPGVLSSGDSEIQDRQTSDPPQDSIQVSVRGQFALDRLRNHFLAELRGAASQALGRRTEVVFALNEKKAHQVDLPLGITEESHNPSSPGPHGGPKPDTTIALPDPRNGSRTGREISTAATATGQTTQTASDHRVDQAHRQTSQSLDEPLQAVASNGNGSPTKRVKPVRRPSNRRSTRNSKSIGGLLTDSVANAATHKAPSTARRRKKYKHQSNAPIQMDFPEIQVANAPTSTKASPSDSTAAVERLDKKMNSANFIPGHCNRLAHTAMVMACQDPSTACPLFLCGPTGTGKTHLLNAIADQLRRRYRLRRVVNLSAEQFTNDFISSVGNSGITAFRRRYREVDALLVDDVQFLGSKKATLREMLYTVETLSGQGKPLIFAGSASPTEIDGLSTELSGRMAAGLVCHMQPLDSETREKLLRRWLMERCSLSVPESLIESIAPLLPGDGRVISGITNVVNTLQRMLGRTPTLEELRQSSGELLRSNQTVATLGLIELAVCQTFQLPADSLRSKSQTRAISGPRKLAMYLSRQLTPSAYSEIGDHFGGRSHSTAISAEQHVKNWLEQGGQVGRGLTAMSAREALDRVQTLIRSA